MAGAWKPGAAASSDGERSGVAFRASGGQARSSGNSGDNMQAELFRNENEGGKTTVSLEQLPDGSLQLFYYDIGEAARRMFGDSDYEAWLTVPAMDLPKLAFALLAEKYGGRADAMSELRTFCEANAIAHDSGVWT